MTIRAGNVSGAQAAIEAEPSALSSLLLTLADDELVIGYWDTEWTGIAPILEEDVAMSSIAQDEIGHALAYYEMLSSLTGIAPGRLRLWPQAGRVPLRAAARAGRGATGRRRWPGGSCMKRQMLSGWRHLSDRQLPTVGRPRRQDAS